MSTEKEAGQIEEEEMIKQPSELLNAIEEGEIKVDAIGINYEIQRLIYEDGVECGDFEILFHRLTEILSDDQIVEITQVLFPGFCNWIEILTTEGRLSAFDFTEFYAFHHEILSQMDDNSCTTCQGNIELIQELFQEEAQRRFESERHSVTEKIKLASTFSSHDHLAEILVTYDETYAEQDNETDDVEDYLELVNPDKILDPVLKTAVMDLIRDSEW